MNAKKGKRTRKDNTGGSTLHYAVTAPKSKTRKVSRPADVDKSAPAVSDDEFLDQDFDFSKAKRATDVVHLNRLRDGKTRITIMLDNNLLDEFRRRAGDGPPGYQTLINQALRDYIAGQDLSIEREKLKELIEQKLNEIADMLGAHARAALKKQTVRHIIREELDRKAG